MAPTTTSPGPCAAFLDELDNSPLMVPGKLYKLTSSVVCIGQVTVMLTPEFSRGPLMYLKREPLSVLSNHSSAVFMNADGMVLRLSGVMLTPAIKAQVIIPADVVSSRA